MEPAQELGVTCSSCGRWFASAIQMDRGTFEMIRLDRLMERCPHCGVASRYDKSDYSFRDIED